MPFIDLSSPDDKQTTPAPIQFQDATPPSATPAPVQTVPQSQPAAATPPAQQPVSVVQTMTGEHELMQTMPDLTQTPTSIDSSGVKEIMGPPLGGKTAMAAPAVTPAPAAVATPTAVAGSAVTKPAAPVVPAADPLGLGDLTAVPAPANPAQGVSLTGTAQGKEQQVAQILQKADQLESEQHPAAAPIDVNAPNPLKPQTAGEKFFSDRASIEDFLNMAEEKGASDLHLQSEYPPMLRVDGKLIALSNQVLTNDRLLELFKPLISEEELLRFRKDLDIDFSYSHKTGTRFRVNLFNKKGQVAGAFRLIPSRIRTIAELGLPDVMYDFARLPHGLVLVTGPTGHGKSTTIASMIQEVNLNEPKHIITIEDPIEYVFPKAKALVAQREIGTDVKDFKRALRASLREDPDVVLVGEMRDFETIAATITVAETGHLVYSTLHTNSAAQSIDRIIDVFPDAQQAQIRAQLANVISAIISQRLVPVSKGGRRAVLEIMIATPAIKNAIREAKTYQIDNMIQTSAESGMITLEKSLIDLVRKGDLTIEEAQSYTTKPDELLSLMKNN